MVLRLTASCTSATACTRSIWRLAAYWAEALGGPRAFSEVLGATGHALAPAHADDGVAAIEVIEQHPLYALNAARQQVLDKRSWPATT